MVITGFLPQAKLVAKSQGLEDLRIAEYPGTMMTDSMEQLVEKVDTVVVENVIKSLTTMPAGIAGRTEEKGAEPGARDIIFTGDLEEVNEYFLTNLWTDGLPIVPPTIGKVERFLSFTDRKPEEVIGILPHEMREATIWNIAVNGVMAGCRPEYMPILIAIVEAVSFTGTPGNLLDGGFRAQDIGTTPGWEPLIIVNGPIARELDFNCGQGVLRFGPRANTSVGRFLKLFVRNVGGFRLPPGTGDKGSIGQSMNVAISENEDFVKQIGWQPYQVDRGFAADENTVTVLSSVAVSGPVYSSGSTGLEHLEVLAEMIGRRLWRFGAVWAIATMRYEPLLMIGPPVAQILAKDGWTKDSIREYLFKNIRVTAAEVQKHFMDFNGIYMDLCDRVKKGQIPQEYCECEDVQREIKVVPGPESIQIIVAGDFSRNQSKGFMQSGYIAPPTTRKIVLPDNWQQRLNTGS